MLYWTGNWVSFVDTMLQMTLLSQPGHSLCLPTRIKSLTIDPELQKKSVVQLEDQKNGKSYATMQKQFKKMSKEYMPEYNEKKGASVAPFP